MRVAKNAPVITTKHDSGAFVVVSAMAETRGPSKRTLRQHVPRRRIVRPHSPRTTHAHMPTQSVEEYSRKEHPRCGASAFIIAFLSSTSQCEVRKRLPGTASCQIKHDRAGCVGWQIARRVKYRVRCPPGLLLPGETLVNPSCTPSHPARHFFNFSKAAMNALGPPFM